MLLFLELPLEFPFVIFVSGDASAKRESDSSLIMLAKSPITLKMTFLVCLSISSPFFTMVATFAGMFC